jgi:hypothetical protein
MGRYLWVWCLSWLLVVGFATGARADDDDDPSKWPKTWIRVCVHSTPGINVWSYYSGKTLPMNEKLFRKLSRGLPVFAFDPTAPPENTKKLDPPDNLRPCEPKPPPKQEEKKKDETPKPAEKKEKASKSDDKKPAAAAPKKEEEPVRLPPLIVYPKKEKDTEPRPRPPENGVTARWPETVLPMKTETVLPNRPVLPVVRREDTERLPMAHVLPMKGSSESAGSGAGDGTKTGGTGDGTKKDGNGDGSDKTVAERIAKELAIAGAIANLDFNQDLKRADGKKYGIVGGTNPNGPNHPAAQAAAGATMVAAVVLSANADKFVKKLKGLYGAAEQALKKGVETKVAAFTVKEMKELGEKAAEELAKAYGRDITSALSHNGAIGPYNVMKKFTDKLGGAYQAHHILEQKFAAKFGLGNADKMPSVILTDVEHKAVTAELRQKAAGIDSAEKLWEVYKDVYKSHPTWLEAIKSYFAK